MKAHAGIVAFLFAAACGSSSSSTSSAQGDGDAGLGRGGGEGGISSFTGVTPCGQSAGAAPGAAGECALSMPVQGALSGTIDVSTPPGECVSVVSAQGFVDLSWGTESAEAR